MIKKAMAYWGAICPGCNIGRKFPNSFIGKQVVKHWEQGCPVHEAYLEVFGKVKNKESVVKTDEEK